jgi:AcrR family transcriptional regulator
MVLITHCGENCDKLNAILDAAQRRFGMYGFEKTSVSEIAADLSMSKASIYYYFSDKSGLFMAVVDREHSEFVRMVEQECEPLTDPADMLRAYVKVNVDFFRKLLNLTRVKHAEMMHNKEIHQMICQLRQNEQAILEKVLAAGAARGIFRIADVKEMSELFLDLQRGLRRMILGKKDVFYLNDEEFNGLVKKAEIFTEIFIKGISA